MYLLEKLKAPKFYRYFFYRQYVFSKNLWDSEPAFSSMLIMSLTILFHTTFFLIIFANVLNIEIIDFLFLNKSPIVVIGLYGVFLIMGYFMFYYKSKWAHIIKEFEIESERSRILGKYLLLIYLFVTFLGLFWMLLWFIESSS